MQPPSVSVVLPSFRLGPVIEANLRRTLDALAGIDGLEVIVVDDGSADGTFETATALAAEDRRLVVVRHAENRGKGEALLSGWRASRGDRVVFLDADLDLPPEQVPALLTRLDGADVVVGAKRSAMESGRYPALRAVLSRVFARSTSGLFRLPVRETQTGLKLFRREVLEKALPEIRIHGYAFDLELLLRAHRSGFRIVEAPVGLREGAGSAVRPRMLLELGRDTLRLAWWALSDPSLRPPATAPSAAPPGRPSG